MKLDYTTIARRFYLRHPLIADIGTQVNFWIVAYLLFFILIYFISKAVTSLYPHKVDVYLGENIIVAIIAAIVFGTILGIVGSCHMLGMATGAYAGGAIFESTQSYYLVFLIQSLLSFLAVIFAFSIKQEKHYLD